MRITETEFFTELTDPKIPAMAAAKRAAEEGNLPQAEKLFADYMRENLSPETFFKIPYVREWYPKEEDREKILARADRILDGWVSSCGFPWHFEGGHVDWITNRTPNGYREWPWQLSRHGEFSGLAAAYLLTGDERYAARYVDMILSWIEQAECPENASGFATETWRTIEAGIRLSSSWNYAMFAFLHSPAMTDRALTLIFMSVYEHGWRLRNFCTGFNWLIHEMSGLLHITLLYPVYRDGAEWQTFAFSKMEEELKTQIYPDDFQFELTTTYHGVVLRYYTLVMDAFTTYGKSVPDNFHEMIVKMYSLYPKIVRPDDTIPDLNDGLERSIRSDMQKALEYDPGNGAFRYIATAHKEGTPPPFTSVTLPYSGMTVFRTDWTEDAMWAYFESAPFGKAHQHEDKLEIELYAYRTKLLTDVGRYDYDRSLMRDFVLSTRAHNTGMVDTFGQNRRKNYEWHPEDLAKKSDISWHFGEDYEVSEGTYADGYGPDLIPVTHHRKMIFFKKGIEGTKPFFVLVDTFTPMDGGEHLYEVHFQLDKEPIRAQGKCVTAKHENGVSLSLISTAYPTILIGQYRPRYMGWRQIYAPGTDHEHMPAPAVTFTEYGGEKTVVTVLYPNNEPTCPILGVALEDDGFSIETTDKSKHFFAFSDKNFMTSPEG
ncbi:MAG TPA: hypothetical protein DDY70_03170 [Clostridiales bacterium]|nr:hypothetical protein [Clostridiales bacterium]